MAGKEGGQPRPHPGTEQTRPRVIRGADLAQLTASRPHLAAARFALAWTDTHGAHLGYNYRRTTIGPDGQTRLLFHYDEPPTFENTYRDWYVGTTPVVSPDGQVHTGALYTLYLNTRSRPGRRALQRFLSQADEAGYTVTRWLPTPRLAATSREGGPLPSVTYLLQPGSAPEKSTPPQA